MVKKAIITGVVLFALYSVFVVKLRPWWWRASQHQWQDNIVQAQYVLYTDQPFTNIIVGSSLSRRIAVDSANETYNTSFSGLSVFDGLNVVTRTPHLPKRVYIETNFVLRDSSKDFSGSVFSPVLFYPRKVLFSLREQNQPIAVVGTHLYNHVQDWAAIHLKPTAQKSAAAADNSKSIFERNLAIHSKTYAETPARELVEERFALLQQYVSLLEARGTQVVFFELPVDKHLENLPTAKVIRETFALKFPADKYAYIPMPDTGSFETTDGIHLNPESAARYSAYFKSRM
ncbi:MAG TPA: hypothetical protein VK174_01830 [Chitinophagales bacterium]|nr:hypothetical protein [Chitinophagales bacterium]